MSMSGKKTESLSVLGKWFKPSPCRTVGSIPTNDRNLSAYIVKHLLRSREGAFGVDHPFCIFGVGDLFGEGVRIAKELQSSKELQLSVVERFLHTLQKEAAKEA